MTNMQCSKARRCCVIMCVIVLSLITLYQYYYVIAYCALGEQTGFSGLTKQIGFSELTYNITSLQNNDIYIRSSIIDRRLFTIRLLVEMPMILIKQFIHSSTCIKYCFQRYKIPV
eukprot:176764_1